MVAFSSTGKKISLHAPIWPKKRKHSSIKRKLPEKSLKRKSPKKRKLKSRTMQRNRKKRNPKRKSQKRRNRTTSPNHRQAQTMQRMHLRSREVPSEPSNRSDRSTSSGLHFRMPCFYDRGICASSCGYNAPRIRDHPRQAHHARWRSR